MNSKNIISLVMVLSMSYPLLSIANNVPRDVSGMSVTQKKSEGKALETLIVLNKNEISLGKLANKKSSNPEVKKFADVMIKEHSENLNKTEALSHELSISLQEDNVSRMLKKNGEKEFAKLNKLQGDAFDKSYCDAMVKGHEQALKIVDGMIATETNESIKEHLIMTKAHVEHHLELAKHLQQSL